MALWLTRNLYRIERYVCSRGDDVQRSIELLDKVLSEYDEHEAEDEGGGGGVDGDGGGGGGGVGDCGSSTEPSIGLTPDDESPSLGIFCLRLLFYPPGSCFHILPVFCLFSFVRFTSRPIPFSYPYARTRTEIGGCRRRNPRFDGRSFDANEESSEV